MRKVVVKNLVADVFDNQLEEPFMHVEFGNEYQLEITWKEDHYEVTNGIDGYGHNCRKEFENEKVEII